MTRDNLIKFLKENYKPKEQLVWQTIAYEDLAEEVEYSTPDNWSEFIEKQNYYGELADEISELVFNKYYDFVQDLMFKEPEEDED
jgi:hypothetical protein